MVSIGIITGRTIGRNRDGDKDRTLLQVQLLDEDIRTVELFSQAGEDVNPANGCRVIVVTLPGIKGAVAVSDDLTPEVDPGEREIYSTDNPATAKKARIKLGSDSVVTINQGTDFAVRYSALEAAFNQLKSDFDLHVHGGVTVGGGSTGATAASTADITGAKVDEVMIP
jgi:hypothetical protein